MPGSVLGTGNTAEKKAHPYPYDTYFLGKELGNKRAKISFQMEICAIKKKPGMKLARPELEGDVLTTGLPGKFTQIS